MQAKLPNFFWASWLTPLAVSIKYAVLFAEIAAAR